MPGSGVGAGRQVVAKKALMGRAGFYFINVGGLTLSIFFSQDIPTVQSQLFCLLSVCFFFVVFS